MRYGYMNDGIRMSNIKNFKKSIYEEKSSEIKTLLKKRNVNVSSGKVLETSTNMSISASICKRKYEQSAGNQE